MRDNSDIPNRTSCKYVRSQGEGYSSNCKIAVHYKIRPVKKDLKERIENAYLLFFVRYL